MIRKIARPMLASVFVIDGVNILRNTEDHVAETEAVLDRARNTVPEDYQSFVPNDPALVARALGGAKVGAGSLLAIGKAPRTSALVLALTTVPTLIGRDAFWEADSKEEKEKRRKDFLTNTALLGGLFITTQDTEGRPSLSWRAKKAGATANKKVQQALPTKSEAQKLTDKASGWIGDTTDKVQGYVDDNKGDWQDAGKNLLATAKGYAEDAKSYVDDNKGDWQETGKGLLETAKDYANDAKKAVTNNSGDWLEAAQDNAKTARKAVVKNASKAQEKADKALSNVDTKKGKRAARKASKQAEELQKKADKAIAKAVKKVGDKVN